MNSATLALARRLSADQWRSGESLAETLGCTRAAIWKQVARLRELGVPVLARAGRGYRLETALELLDAAALRAALGERAGGFSGIEVVPETGSTNADLMARRPSERLHRHALLAERQTAGRGRRGRPWLSPFARNVYLSLGWCFEAGLGALGLLPLVVAVSAARALERLGLQGHGIKWPNDIVHDSDKLGGCLVEVRGDLGGPCLAVMGVGLNVHLAGAAETAAIDQPWTDLATHVPGVTRPAVAAGLLGALLEGVEAFEARGFEPFEADWARFDVLDGRRVDVREEGGVRRGTARGLGPRGGLLLEEEGGCREVFAGDVSVRAAD